MHDPLKDAKPLFIGSGHLWRVVATLAATVLSAVVLAKEGAETLGVSLPQAPIMVANPESRHVALRSDLDVGISVTTEVPSNSGTKAETSFRRTEAQLLAAKQRIVFEESGRWGVVRLYPEPSLIPELMLELVVLQSDGRELLIKVILTSVSGDLLLSGAYMDRSYFGQSSRDDVALEAEDPFADLFHRIHVDVADAVSQYERSERYLDTLSFLRYAQQLAPTAFPGYLAMQDGQWQLLREPSDIDPMYKRVAKLRAYELLFVDTIDEQLSGALRDIDAAYRLWLQASKEQLDWLERRRERGLNVNSFTDDSTFARHQAVYAAYRSLKIHEQELFELVLDLESESRSTALELEETVVKLEGTLAQQYREWREALLTIIRLENAF